MKRPCLLPLDVLPVRRLVPVLSLVLVWSALDGSPHAWAWGRGHRLIRSWSIEKLPDWQKQLFDEKLWKRLANDCLSLQDRYAGGNASELDQYCMVPGHHVSLHDVNPPEPSVGAISWYLNKITEHVESGEHDEAMRYLGVLCHWNEDPGSPSAHSGPVSETILRQLIPPPSDKVCDEGDSR